MVAVVVAVAPYVVVVADVNVAAAIYVIVVVDDDVVPSADDNVATSATPLHAANV